MFFEPPLLDALAKGALLSTLGIAWVILLVRVVGLRSFSKMTNFDFVMTVAMGSLLAGASQSDGWAPLVQTLAAMAALFGVQYAVSRLRFASSRFDEVVQNTPLLLMKDGVILRDALRQTRVTEDDLIAKLREANAGDISRIRAVILETTGNISVIHGTRMDALLLQGVRLDAAGPGSAEKPG